MLNPRSPTQTKRSPNSAFTPVYPGLLQRKCACGKSVGLTGKCSDCQHQNSALQRSATDQTKSSEVPPIKHEILSVRDANSQPTLKIGNPNDKYEQEADRIANQIMRISKPGKSHQFSTTAQENDRLQMKANINSPSSSSSNQAALSVPPSVHKALGSTGRPLEALTKQRMESRFGQDFSQVRLHTDGSATEAAKSVQAKAFTVGKDIVFQQGMYTPNDSTSQHLLAHELVHTLQQTRSPHLIQRAPADETKVKTEKDPLCTSFNFLTTKGLIFVHTANYVADKNIDHRLTLIRTLKLVWRCATPQQQEEVRKALATILEKDEVAAIWAEAGTPFGGYTGAYPSYAPGIKRRLNELGTSETRAIDSFKFSEVGSGRTHRSRAKRKATGDIPDLERTDILYFRGHQFAQYRAPGLFSNGKETKGFDLRYVDKTGGFENVKLMISTSCATLCQEAFNVFHGLFPKAVILGYRKSAPLEGAKVRDALQAKVTKLGRPLLLTESVDINSIISAWRSVIEERHTGDTAQLPGYYDGSTLHYWDGSAWQMMNPTDATNQCRRKGDFRGQYPEPP